MRRAAFPLILALAGCQAEDQEGRALGGSPEAASGAVQAPAPAAAPVVALDGEGIRLVLENGATRLLAFGAPRDQAETAVGSALSHEPERTAMAECGAGPMEFTAYGPLQLNFQGGAFAGWSVDGAGGPSTIDGIAVGSAAPEVRGTRTLSMIPESTLGHEFTLGERTGEGIGGFFDSPGPDAKVTRLYAGINCFFR